MTHLYIEQDTGSTEEVTSAIISKLYGLASSGNLDETSDLKGRLHLDVSYRAPINYLTSHYPDLYITADDYAIPFEDPNMLLYLLSLGIGSNGYITEDQAAAATIVANSRNTTITKFNELKYFTNITSSNGGFVSASTGKTRFYNWNALEEIDISNFESIGHDGQYGWEDTFRECNNLKTVTASSNLTKIGHSAFCLCSNLETISGLSGTITIADSAFLQCNKLKLENFDNVVFNFVSGRGVYAFSNCKLITDIAFDGQMTTIPGSLFFGASSLTSVTGLSNVTLIDAAAFSECTSLSSLDLDYSKLVTIQNNAFRQCSSLTSFDLSNVQTINDNAFNNSGLTGVINLSNIVTLKSGAFSNCNNITLININPNVSTIEGALGPCSSLIKVTGLNNLTSLPTRLLFLDRNLQDIDINFSNVTNIGTQCFLDCENLSMTLDLSNVTTLGESAFLGCKKLIISSFPKMTTLSNSAFSAISNSSVTIPKEVLTIGNSCFQSLTHLTTVNFESNSLLITLGTSAFRYCAMSSIVLPSGVTTLGGWCFSNCNNLTEIDMPSSVTSIGENLCRYTVSVTKVICRATTPPTLGATAFENNNNLNIYVPDASVNAYKAATNWSTYSSKIKGISLLPS